MRQILAEERKAQPDTVLYGDSCVLFHWNGVTHSVVVTVSDKGEIMETRLREPPVVAQAYERAAGDEQAPPPPSAQVNGNSRTPDGRPADEAGRHRDEAPRPKSPCGTAPRRGPRTPR